VTEQSSNTIKWTIYKESVLFGSYIFNGVPDCNEVRRNNGQRKTHKLALIGFDLDDTLISTKSGLKFARNEKDWKFRFAKISMKEKINNSIRQILSKGTVDEVIMCIFTNQSGVKLAIKPKKSSNKRIKLEHDPRPQIGVRAIQFKQKLEEILQALELPCYVIAATGKDEFRKPNSGMWNMIRSVHEIHHQLHGAASSTEKSERMDNHGVHIELDTQNSIFVGDAAGRKSDFSDSDIMFAKNLNIQFVTPEEYF
ncbi:polynucleotide kinase 3 phosphatase-domain-containing protein, partial [Dipodascopsis uninucleata]